MKLRIDTRPLTENAEYLYGLAEHRGLGIAAVIKSAAAHPDIVAALAAGGVRRFYLSNPAALDALAAIPREHRALVRLPRLSEIPHIPNAFRLSLQSDIDKIDALRRAAAAAGAVHGILLAIDLGDRREGLLPEEIGPFAAKLAPRLGDWLELEGVLVSFACASGFLPQPAHFGMITDLVRRIEDTVGTRLTTVSVGGSVVLDYLLDDVDFGRVTEMRGGEAFLLGTITTARKAFPGLNPNAFVFSGEVLEAKTRLIVADERCGLDALNRPPRVGREGLRYRLLADFGALHTEVQGLSPLQDGLEIVTATGEYTVLDATALDPTPKVGDRIGFRPDYAALAVALLSPLVEVEVAAAAVRPDKSVESAGAPASRSWTG